MLFNYCGCCFIIKSINQGEIIMEKDKKKTQDIDAALLNPTVNQLMNTPNAAMGIGFVLPVPLLNDTIKENPPQDHNKTK